MRQNVPVGAGLITSAQPLEGSTGFVVASVAAAAAKDGTVLSNHSVLGAATVSSLQSKPLSLAAAQPPSESKQTAMLYASDWQVADLPRAQPKPSGRRSSQTVSWSINGAVISTRAAKIKGPMSSPAAACLMDLQLLRQSLAPQQLPRQIALRVPLPVAGPGSRNSLSDRPAVAAGLLRVAASEHPRLMWSAEWQDSSAARSMPAAGQSDGFGAAVAGAVLMLPRLRSASQPQRGPAELLPAPKAPGRAVISGGTNGEPISNHGRFHVMEIPVSRKYRRALFVAEEINGCTGVGALAAAFLGMTRCQDLCLLGRSGRTEPLVLSALLCAMGSTTAITLARCDVAVGCETHDAVSGSCHRSVQSLIHAGTFSFKRNDPTCHVIAAFLCFILGNRSLSQQS